MLNAQTKHSGLLAGKYCVFAYYSQKGLVEIFQTTYFLLVMSKAIFWDRRPRKQGEGKRGPSCFSCGFNFFTSLQISQSLHMNCGRCYAGNIFLIALPFIFISCSNSKMANPAEQYKNTRNHGTTFKQTKNGNNVLRDVNVSHLVWSRAGLNLPSNLQTLFFTELSRQCNRW